MMGRGIAPSNSVEIGGVGIARPTTEGVDQLQVDIGVGGFQRLYAFGRPRPPRRRWRPWKRSTPSATTGSPVKRSKALIAMASVTVPNIVEPHLLRLLPNSGIMAWKFVQRLGAGQRADSLCRRRSGHAAVTSTLAPAQDWPTSTRSAAAAKVGPDRARRRIRARHRRHARPAPCCVRPAGALDDVVDEIGQSCRRSWPGESQHR